jgi:type II secretory pathway component GspD/PulD (secretin)
MFLSTLIISAESIMTGSEDKLTIKVKDADIKDLLMFLAEVTGKNIVLDPTVKGKVTLYLKDVSWKEALKAILFFNDLGYVEIGANGIIAPYEKLTSQIGRMTRGRKGMKNDAALTTILLPLSFERAKALWPGIKKMLGAKGKFLYDRKNRNVQIIDYSDNAERIMSYILMKGQNERSTGYENKK